MKNKYLFLFTFLTCLMVGCSTEIIEYYNPEVEGDSEQPKPDPCLLYTSPSPRDRTRSRMPSSA